MNQIAVAGTPTAPALPVNSFDVFDTLIARRCITSDSVFARMERELAWPGFARLRQAAEAALAGTEYSLADIYRGLAQLAAVPQPVVDTWREAEIAVEQAEVIPIAENLQRVRDGDLLVSDMYLDPAVIRTLLDRAGLDRQVGLLVTPHGKSSGAIWPRLREQFTIGRHLGDNPHSDVAMPARFGIAAEHTAISAPSGIEGWLLGVGLGDLARVLREARLRSWTPDPLTRHLQLIQVQLNAPILLLASVLLHRLAGRLGSTTLLFASRDCNLWLTLFRAMAGNLGGKPLAATYFHTSRKARVDASPAYCAYAAERLGHDALLVDLCGSGWSTSLLLRSLGLRDRHCFFVHRLPAVPLYERRAATPETCHLHAAVAPVQAGLDHVRLEMANYADHGSVIGMRRIGAAMLPVLDADGRSKTELRLVAAQHAAFTAVVDIVRQTPLPAMMALDDATIAAMIAEFYKLLSREAALSTAFGHSHHGEDMRTLLLLDLLPPNH